jgi:hypothetical protein
MRIKAELSPVAVSQIRTVWSLLAEASQRPSGATATAFTQSRCPVSRARCYREQLRRIIEHLADGADKPAATRSEHRQDDVP